MTASSPPPAAAPRPSPRLALLVLVAVYYLVVVLAHQWVSDRVGDGYHLFKDWFAVPGDGKRGARIFFRSIAAAMVLVFVVYVAAVAWRHRRASRRAFARVGAVWGLYGSVLAASYMLLGQVPTELVHFLQYTVLAMLLLAVDGRPRVVLVLGTLLGMADETFQYISLYNWGETASAFYYDWNDIVLDQLGILGGLLPLVTARLLASSADDAEPAFDPGRLALAVLSAAALLGVVVATGGYGADRPFIGWRGIAFHPLTTPEGIAALLGLGGIGFAILGPPLPAERDLLDRLRGAPPVAAAGAAAVLVLASVFHLGEPSWRTALREGEWDRVPRLLCRRVDRPIEIDGRLDEAVWAGADAVDLVLDPFGEPIPDAPSTRARALWSDDHLYVAFECADADIWGVSSRRDDPRLPLQEVVEVFIDTEDMGRTYVEVEVSPRNVVYDLLVLAFPPDDRWPSSRRRRGRHFEGLPTWDAPGLATAVSVEGTLDDPSDRDRGFGVEMAVPFAALPILAGGKPAEGERWRVGLFRVERPDRPAAAAATSGGLAGAARPAIRRDRADLAPQMLCWSPPRDASFHRPRRFGTFVFTRTLVGD